MGYCASLVAAEALLRSSAANAFKFIALVVMRGNKRRVRMLEEMPAKATYTYADHSLAVKSNTSFPTIKPTTSYIPGQVP
jgi:hypothetical protein